MSKYLDTRDLSKRKDELEGYKTALDAAQDELDQLNTNKPGEDDPQLTRSAQAKAPMTNHQIADTRTQALLSYVAAMEAKEKPQTARKP